MSSPGLIDTLANPGTRIIVDTADDVMISRIQHALNLMGRHIAVDGEFGPITAAAIKSVNNRSLHGNVWDLMHPPAVPAGSVPEWTRVALGEYRKGIREVPGPVDNPEIVKYWKAFPKTAWIDDDETPWCAIAQGWCLLQSGHKEMIPDNPASALAYLEVGEAIDAPVFGAFGVKRRYRRGRVIGGHIAQAVGIDRKRRTVYMLGGNQGNMWSVREYPLDVWTWRIVPGYVAGRELGYWNGLSQLAGSEA